MSSNMNAPMSEDGTSSGSSRMEEHHTGPKYGYNFESSRFDGTSTPLSFDKENVSPSSTKDKTKDELSVEGNYEGTHSRSSWGCSSISNRDDVSIDYEPDGPSSECEFEQYSFEDEGETAGLVKNWPQGQYLTPQEIIKQGLVPDWMVKQLEDKHGLSIARMTRDEAMQKKKEEQRLAELRGSMPCTVEIRRMTPAEVEQMNQRKAQEAEARSLIDAPGVFIRKRDGKRIALKELSQRELSQSVSYLLSQVSGKRKFGDE